MVRTAQTRKEISERGRKRSEQERSKHEKPQTSLGSETSERVSKVPPKKTKAASKHKKNTNSFRDIYKIPRRSVRKLADKAGVLKLKGDAYIVFARKTIETLSRLSRLATIYARYSRRWTITSDDFRRAGKMMKLRVIG